METIVAKELLKIKAVFLRPNDPFTWASGIQSPIYCDNRLTLSYPKTRKIIEEALAQKVQTEFPQCEYIMGTATAGIAHAALVSEILDVPMGYVRSLNKSHGRTNKIEGAIVERSKVVVIEDLISTGGSSIEVAQVLRQSGFDVLGVVAIFSYDLEIAKEKFLDANISFYSVSNYNVLKDVAVEENYIEAHDLSKLNKWRDNPQDKNWMN